MKFYIATGLENHQRHNQLRDWLVNIGGHTITYDWTAHGPVFRHGLWRCRKVSILEMNGVQDADVVIVLLPGGRGTHAEMGAAIAWEKPILLYGEDPLPFTAHESACAFYSHPLVATVSGPFDSFYYDIGEWLDAVSSPSWRDARFATKAEV